MTSRLVEIARNLSDAVDALEFDEPVTHVYNPLEYARAPHEKYLEDYGEPPPREAVFVGMNPGPWGMAQTGVPFGEISYVRDWMGIDGDVGKPDDEHPKREIVGFDCERSEVSGSRLWGWAADRFGGAVDFFERFFVWNYCPLVFMEESCRNRTPNKLPKAEREALFAPCDDAVRAVIDHLEPEWVVGIGAFAERRVKRALADRDDVRIGRVLHPSPASPKANQGWVGHAERELGELGLLG